MKRSEVTEIVSAGAVVIGLVFVGLQLHQNTTVQRITATQVLTAEYGDALEVLSYEGEAACVYVLGINGLANLDDAQRLRFFVIWFRIFRAAEQLQYYSTEGMVEPRIWRGFERQLNEVARLPGVQEWWKLRRNWFSDQFQAYIEALISSGPSVRPQTFQNNSCAAGR